MHPKVLHKFFTKLENDHFDLVYLGEFDNLLTDTLMRINETSIDTTLVFKNKLSFLIAECFQNIVKHADKPQLITRTNNKPNMFLVRNTDKEFYIASTNLIDNEKKAGLEAKLKTINTLSQDELKSVYIGALAASEFSGKSAGGISLIEMATRSHYPLAYDFEFVNYFLSVFYMQLRVGEKIVETEKVEKHITLESTRQLYNSMLSENILMLRKGDFSQRALLPVLQLIENNLEFKQQVSSGKKKTIYLIVELLQNISKHAAEHNDMCEGIFIISGIDGTYTLNAGNYVRITEVDKLQGKLKLLTSMDQPTLTELYKTTLLKSEKSSEKGAGLGLIEMCRYSGKKLKYNFIPVNDELSFFSLSITM